MKNIGIVFLLAIGSAFAQEGKTKRANNHFDNYAFVDAIMTYEDLVANGHSDETVFKKLGNAHYFNARYQEASEWYGKLIGLKNADIEREYYYRYAQTLKSLGDYATSNEWMQKFAKQAPQDQRAVNFIEKQNYLKEIARNSGRYTIENMSINTSASDFAPSFHGEALVFTTARDTGLLANHTHKWNNAPFLNLHMAKVTENGQWGIPERFTKKLNTKTHESSSVFTKDGNTVYFTRNNSQNGRFARDGEGVSRLKIYRSQLKDGVWQADQELPFNNDNYSVAHPALGSDGKTLYFSSDMPGSLGASDLYKVSINDDGSYGLPENLGVVVNTEGREGFPSITDDILYFSSDGHPGLGGLDVFAINLNKLENAPQNLGGPINGKWDDFSYVVRGDEGFFASNREGGKGNDDIYAFTEERPLLFSCHTMVHGTVRNANDRSTVANVKVKVSNAVGDEVATAISNGNGSFELELDCTEKSFSVIADKQGYMDGVTDFELGTGDVNKEIELLLRPQVAKAGTDLTTLLQLNPIYFDLNKALITPKAAVELQKVLDYMNRYPQVRIAIQSHTDSRGRDSYNLKLSDRRANATRSYLIEKGIDAGRLTAKGFGERQLKNHCGNTVKCTDIEHDSNRRSEFIVLDQ